MIIGGVNGCVVYSMMFKRKKDNVKALHATLKELQGIDPLDYLAKYSHVPQTEYTM